MKKNLDITKPRHSQKLFAFPCMTLRYIEVPLHLFLSYHIFTGRENNFLKYDNGFIDSLGSPYDYGSVMHYGDKFFSKNGLPTIVVLTPGVCCY